MSAGTLMPAPFFTVLDDGGVSISGGQLEFYASGTSAHLAAYADAALTTPLANPAIADAAGRLVAYLSPTSYKITVRTAAGVAIRTIDPVQSTGGVSGGLVGSALGEAFVFGGDSTSPVTAVAYPAGATFDKLHAGTAVLNLDSANLAAGEYEIEAMFVSAAGTTTTVAIMDLDSGAPDTPLASASSASVTGERVRSGPIIFSAAGVPRNYGIKAKVDAGSGFVWGVRLLRVT